MNAHIFESRQRTPTHRPHLIDGEGEAPRPAAPSPREELWCVCPSSGPQCQRCRFLPPCPALPDLAGASWSCPRGKPLAARPLQSFPDSSLGCDEAVTEDRVCSYTVREPWAKQEGVQGFPEPLLRTLASALNAPPPAALGVCCPGQLCPQHVTPLCLRAGCPLLQAKDVPWRPVHTCALALSEEM